MYQCLGLQVEEELVTTLSPAAAPHEASRQDVLPGLQSCRSETVDGAVWEAESSTKFRAKGRHLTASSSPK